MRDSSREPVSEQALPFVTECDDGWSSLVTACHAELLSLDPNYVVLQVKEKFGGLRYYYATTHEPSDSRAQAMRNAVTKYETMSFSVCEACGEPGEHHQGASGWWKTACESCRRP